MRDTRIDRPARARLAFGIGAALAAIALLPGRVAASGEAGPFPEHRGYAEYRQYCASCHGVTGDGQGLLAPLLKIPPPDLRLLSIRYGDPLPRARLAAFVDGRRVVRAHGSAEMPVWGRVLDGGGHGDPASEGRLRGTLLAIVDYLEALQLDRAADPDPG